MNNSSRAALVAAVVGVALLAACSPGDGGSVVTPQGTASAEPTATSTAPVTKVTEAGINEPPALKDGATSVILDVRLSKCESGPGKVTAAGSVTNHSDATRDIVVTAAWNAPDNSKTYAKSSAVLKGVPVGDVRDWEIDTTVEVPKDAAVMCTFSAMSGELK